MIRFRITQVFMIILVLTIFCSMIVGICWLFDSKPINLYIVWRFLIGCLTGSFLVQLLFGTTITFK
jgi:hypothetical protein